MRYKKIMIITIILIASLAVSTISATDIDTNDTKILSASDNDEILRMENDSNLLNPNEGTYSDLRNEIGAGGNIKLTKSAYHYVANDGNTTIEINNNGVIDGNGAIIDMIGSNFRVFKVNATDVTIKNLTIKNAKHKIGDDGTIYFSNSGTVENCNFIDNEAIGAVRFQDYDGRSSGTVKNCNFTNNTRGVMIYFNGYGTVENCNFIDNEIKANAVYYSEYYGRSSGSVKNCNFTNNSGGAIYFGGYGTVENCNFIYNKAKDNGGAIYFGMWNRRGVVTNCNFTNNSAQYSGGAIMFSGSGDVTNCNFNDNSARKGGAVFFLDESSTNTLTNCNFTNNRAYNNGGAITFDGLSSSNTVTNCNFNNNSAQCNGGAIESHGANSKHTVTNCNFTNNRAHDNGGAISSFSENNLVNCNLNDNSARNGGAIHMSRGSVKNCNFNNNFASYSSGAIFMYQGSVENCNFTNNTVLDADPYVITSYSGGAIYIQGNCKLTNCNFISNTAEKGGAIRFDIDGEVINCNFTNNNAISGSAIYFKSSSSTKTILNSCFLNNKANAKDLEVVKNDNNITITFTGNDNLLNAIYSNGNVNITNVIYWGVNKITNTGSSTIALSGSNNEAGQNITVLVLVNDITILNTTNITDSEGKIVLDIDIVGNYTIVVCHDEDSYYTKSKRIITNIPYYVNVTPLTTNNKTVNITAETNINNEIMQGKLLFILPNSIKICANYNTGGTWWALHTFDDFGDYNIQTSYSELDGVLTKNATISIRNDVPINVNDISIFFDEVADIVVSVPETINGQNITITVNGTSKSVRVKGSEAKTIFIDLPVGKHVINVVYLGDCKNSANSTTTNLTVNKLKTQLTTSTITTTYNINKNLVITLKDSHGKSLRGVKVTIDLNGRNYAPITDEKGQVKLTTKSLAPGVHLATISFAGNTNYAKSSKSIKVIVKKATPKLTAKAKTFKHTVKTKKYTIALKTNQNKVMKNKKVTLTVNKKTYRATTNSKGVATFKLTKLTKKGKYTAVVNYSGSKYYNIKTVKPKITVK